MKRLFQPACIASLLGLGAMAHAQAVPTESRIAILRAGAGWSVGNPRDGWRSVQGFSLYGNLDFSRHWGIEGDIHRASLVTPGHTGLDSYLLGPRYVYHHNSLSPYAKVLVGLGRFRYMDLHTAYTFKIVVLGVGLDLSLTKRIHLRTIDFEYQRWPDILQLALLQWSSPQEQPTFFSASPLPRMNSRIHRLRACGLSAAPQGECTC